MALVPLKAYPTQTLSASAGYPYGSARNIVVVGDGLGFPLEKDWPNDIFGLLQSLLVEAAITPNESPDSVTNPQYLTALKAVALAHVAANLDGNSTFLGSAFTWAGFHTFASGASMSSLLVSGGGATQFSGAVSITHATNEVIYSAARTRTVMVSPSSGMSEDPANKWTRLASPLDGVISDDAVNAATFFVPLRLPHGSTLIQVRSGVRRSGGSGGMTMQVYRQGTNKVTPGTTTVPTALGALDTAIDDGVNGDVLTSGGFAEVIDAAENTYGVRFTPSTGKTSGNSDRIHWIEVTYSETRATGSH